MSVSQNLKKIKSEIPNQVTLVAISKTHPVDTVLQAYNAGHKIFGENKVQELVSKFEALPNDIQWHMVGHLQTNKVKYIAPFVHLIHSVDSLKLLKEINKQAQKNNRVIDCLLQMHIAEEETKFGLSIDELADILKSKEYTAMKNIRILGLMAMATFTENMDQVRREFRELKKYFKIVKQEYFRDNQYFSSLSIGMSDDYKVAIEEGSTMIRVGSLIFGNRFYCTN